MTPLTMKTLQLLETLNGPIPINDLADRAGGQMLGAHASVVYLEEQGACTLRNGLVYPDKANIRQMLAEPPPRPATPPVMPSKPIQEQERRILARVGAEYGELIRRAGKHLNDLLGTLKDGHRVQVKSNAFHRTLAVKNGEIVLAKLIGAYTAWRVRHTSPGASDKGYPKAWATFERLMPPLSHEALRLIIPHAVGAEFSELVDKSNVRLFACAWICYRQQIADDDEAIRLVMEDVTETLAMVDHVGNIPTDELSELRKEIEILFENKKFLDCARYLLWGIDKIEKPMTRESDDG